MVIDDPIYGRVVLDATQDALLIDLIQSPVVQRLKQGTDKVLITPLYLRLMTSLMSDLSVLQHGISAVNGLALSGAAVTRFAHSVGACLLVRQVWSSIRGYAGFSSSF